MLTGSGLDSSKGTGCPHNDKTPCSAVYRLNSAFDSRQRGNAVVKRFLFAGTAPGSQRRFSQGAPIPSSTNHMIENRNPQPLAASVKPVGDTQILRGWIRISGRVIVSQNHCCRRVNHGWPEDFSGMNDAGGQGTDTDHTVANQSVTDIQQQQTKMLAGISQPASSQMIVDLSR